MEVEDPVPNDVETEQTSSDVQAAVVAAEETTEQEIKIAPVAEEEIKIEPEMEQETNTESEIAEATEPEPMQEVAPVVEQTEQEEEVAQVEELNPLLEQANALLEAADVIAPTESMEVDPEQKQEEEKENQPEELEADAIEQEPKLDENGELIPAMPKEGSNFNLGVPGLCFSSNNVKTANDGTKMVQIHQSQITPEQLVALQSNPNIKVVFRHIPSGRSFTKPPKHLLLPGQRSPPRKRKAHFSTNLSPNESGGTDVYSFDEGEDFGEGPVKMQKIGDARARYNYGGVNKKKGRPRLIPEASSFAANFLKVNKQQSKPAKVILTDLLARINNANALHEVKLHTSQINAEVLANMDLNPNYRIMLTSRREPPPLVIEEISKEETEALKQDALKLEENEKRAKEEEKEIEEDLNNDMEEEPQEEPQEQEQEQEVDNAEEERLAEEREREKREKEAKEAVRLLKIKEEEDELLKTVMQTQTSRSGRIRKPSRFSLDIARLTKRKSVGVSGDDSSLDESDKDVKPQSKKNESRSKTPAKDSMIKTLNRNEPKLILTPVDTPKKGRGRPKKIKTEEDETNKEESEDKSETEKKTEEQTTPKRGRGRPRKSQDLDISLTEEKSEESGKESTEKKETSEEEKGKEDEKEETTESKEEITEIKEETTESKKETTESKEETTESKEETTESKEETTESKDETTESKEETAEPKETPESKEEEKSEEAEKEGKPTEEDTTQQTEKTEENQKSADEGETSETQKEDVEMKEHEPSTTAATETKTEEEEKPQNPESMDLEEPFSLKIDEEEAKETIDNKFRLRKLLEQCSVDEIKSVFLPEALDAINIGDLILHKGGQMHNTTEKVNFPSIYKQFEDLHKSMMKEATRYNTLVRRANKVGGDKRMEKVVLMPVYHRNAADALDINSLSIDAHICGVQKPVTTQIIAANSFYIKAKMDTPTLRLTLPEATSRSLTTPKPRTKPRKPLYTNHHQNFMTGRQQTEVDGTGMGKVRQYGKNNYGGHHITSMKYTSMPATKRWSGSASKSNLQVRKPTYLEQMRNGTQLPSSGQNHYVTIPSQDNSNLLQAIPVDSSSNTLKSDVDPMQMTTPALAQLQAAIEQQGLVATTNSAAEVTSVDPEQLVVTGDNSIVTTTTTNSETNAQTEQFFVTEGGVPTTVAGEGAEGEVRKHLVPIGDGQYVELPEGYSLIQTDEGYIIGQPGSTFSQGEDGNVYVTNSDGTTSEITQQDVSAEEGTVDVLDPIAQG